MKFMNMKRFASTVMAGALALSLAAPAFASGNTNITGSYRAITLAVTVPATGQAIINPYGLPFELGEGVSISGEQITTGAPLLIQNKSAVGLSVSATAVGEVKSGSTFTFASSAITPDTETAKTAHVKLQVFPAPGVTADNATDTAVLNEMFANLADDTEGHVAAKDITVAVADPDSPATPTTDIITLREGDADGALQDGGAAFFRLSGTVAKKPTNAWSNTDGFSVKVAFTFEPKEFVKDGGTLNVAGITPTGTTTKTYTLSMATHASGVAVTVDDLNLPTGVTIDTNSVNFVSSKTANVKFENDSSTASALKGKLTPVAATATSSTVKVYAEFTGSDGILYRTNEITVKVTA